MSSHKANPKARLRTTPRKVSGSEMFIITTCYRIKREKVRQSIPVIVPSHARHIAGHGASQRGGDRVASGTRMNPFFVQAEPES
jgi:hypothetical protein